MVTFLTDDTGDILINPQGLIIELEGDDELYQRITNIFSTQKGTELFLENYGFDKINFARQNIFSKETAFNFYVMDALNPENLFGIDSITDVVTKIEETTLGGKKVSIGYINMTINVSNKQTNIGISITGG